MMIILEATTFGDGVNLATGALRTESAQKQWWLSSPDEAVPCFTPEGSSVGMTIPLLRKQVQRGKVTSLGSPTWLELEQS